MSSIITDTYQRAFQVLAANERYKVPTPFTALMLGQPPVIDMASEEVTITTYKGNQKVAPLVSRRHMGSNVGDTVIQPGQAGVNDYLFALISQDFRVPASALNKRVPEEPLYMPGTTSEEIKAMRRRYWVNKEGLDGMRRVMQRAELLALQSFRDGEMNIGDTYQSATKLVFPRASALKARTVSVSWATAATAVPWTDYGLAQKAIKTAAQINGSGMWVSFLSGATMEKLRAIYRSQRPNDAGPTVRYDDFSFNPENGAPAELAFLIQNGMEYGGWVRSDYSNSKVHLFTLPEGYDATADDTSVSFTDYISGATVSLCFYDPTFFRAFYGPGKKDEPSGAFYTANFPPMSMPSISPAGLTLGVSRIPANTFLLNMYPLGNNEGLGGTIEHAPIFANIYPDVVATIATETTA